MRIGEVSASAGVNQQTIRFYEREGVLPDAPRRENGYREYSADTVALVRFIKRAQDLGFSLDEAKALSDLRTTAGRDRPKARAVAEAKLADVRQRIAQLRAIERALAALLTDCCHDGAQGCPIIDALDDSPDRLPHSRRRS
jgi:DNA-binding transcriptional MerR regulator